MTTPTGKTLVDAIVEAVKSAAAVDQARLAVAIEDHYSHLTERHATDQFKNNPFSGWCGRHLHDELTELVDARPGLAEQMEEGD